MIWWLVNPARARAERQGIADLAEQVGWLRDVRWYSTDGFSLTVDFDIEHDGETAPLRMTYGSFHPNGPPMVVPRDEKQWLSSHQFGPGGNLCLEYRADNWQTTITGAMMIESAHRLIAGERKDNGDPLPSEHYQSIGQRARGHRFRFILTPEAEERLSAIADGQCVEIGLSEKIHAETITTTVTEINGGVVPGAWPSGIREILKRGYAIRLPAGTELPRSNEQGIRTLLENLGLAKVRDQAAMPGGEMDLVLMAGDQGAHFYAYDGDQTRHYGRSRTLLDRVGQQRLPDNYGVLGVKSVGIVGCGSLGSKVAAILARSGVRNFTLVDDDVLFSANLVRNDLSASAIGAHKVDGVKARLKDIVGTIEVATRKVALGGQESPESIESVMSALSSCDVIIDTTANAHCFNFCAAVAKGGPKPLVWGEVFAGGIGGLVARVRPDLEPEPQVARNQINAWCDAHGIEAPVSAANVKYEGVAESDASEPLIADDSEVTIIASHLARFAIDVLVRPTESMFPVPAYAIGLRNEWIFTAPLETWPIEFHGGGPWEKKMDPATVAESIELLREFIPSIFNDKNPSAE